MINKNGGMYVKIIDISREVLSCPVYPGDPVATLERVKNIDVDCQYNLSKIDMCLHNGTHMDAPLHFLPDGGDITEIPHEVFFGPCVVVETEYQRSQAVYCYYRDLLPVASAHKERNKQAYQQAQR